MTEGECECITHYPKDNRAFHPQAPPPSTTEPPLGGSYKKCHFLSDEGTLNSKWGDIVSLNYNKENIVRAKELRKSQTPQEKELWYKFLSTYKYRFQRQKAIDNFIADFYCHKANLIIEIDGSQHYTPEGKAHDEFRTEILEGYDLKVIRFTNEQIDKNLKGVCEYIDKVISEIV